MPIYGKNGEILSTVYDKNGNIITMAYDKSGNVIYNQSNPQKKEWNYADYNISTFFQYPISSAQSFSIHDGKIAQIQENNSLHIIDIESGEKIRNVTMDMGHGNSCQFSNEFYSQDDEFPLFYERNDGIWVYRIVDTASILICKYSFPSSEVYTYVAGFGVDSKNGRLYTASYTEGSYITKTGIMCICEYDMNNVTNNVDGTISMTLLRRNSFEWFDRFQAVQGCCYKDGYLFISTGYTGNTNQDVVLVNVSTLTIDYVVSLGAGSEIEGCAWGDDYRIVGQRTNTYTYKKIEFAETSNELNN